MPLRNYKYMHTLNGKPAIYNRRLKKIVTANGYASSEDDLFKIKAQQRISKKKDKSRKKYGYVKVFVE